MRLITNFVLFTAMIIIVGHNLVPHHHHESEIEVVEHHHHDHSHEDETINLNDILSHFIHGSFSYVTLTKSHVDAKLFNQFIAIIAENTCLSGIYIPPLINISPHDLLLGSSHYFLPSGLRGPPSC